MKNTIRHLIAMSCAVLLGGCALSSSSAAHEAANQAPGTADQARDGFPEFSWDHVPLYAHAGIGDGLEPEQYKFLADHFDLICLSGGALRGKGSIEPNIAAGARAIKQRNPKAKVLSYWAADMLKHQWKLSNATFPKDGHLPKSKYFDVKNQDVRDWWSDVAGKAVHEYSCDGFFADGALRWFPGRLGHQKTADADAAMKAMFKEAKQKMGPGNKLIIFNGLQINKSEQYFQVTDGGMFDDILRSDNVRPMGKEVLAARIEKMRQTSQDGKITVFKAWPGFCWWSDKEMMKKPHDEIHRVAKENITFPLACFLVGAGPNCYFCYTWGWMPEYGTFDWYPEFDKPLGAPKGDAVRKGWTYTREFAHASVFVDLETKTAKIDWR